jgi:hypothetical protein
MPTDAISHHDGSESFHPHWVMSQSDARHPMKASNRLWRGIAMTVMEWMLWMTLAVIYIVCLFTVCTVIPKGAHRARYLRHLSAFPVADRGDPAAEGRFGLRA